MLKRIVGSSVMAAVVYTFGVRNSETLEKQIAGGKALYVRGLIGRKMIWAHGMQALKKHKAARG